MAHYRKIDVRIWNDEKFRELSDDGKFLFFFVLTHPHLTSVGAMRATIPGLAAEIGWDVERVSKGFGEGLGKGLVEHDPKASFLGVPNFLKYNPPENPNVVKSFEKVFDLLPECKLKSVTMQRVKGYGKPFQKGSAKGTPNRMPNRMPNREQEQERDREQEQDKKSKAALAAGDIAIPSEIDTPEVRDAVDRWLTHKRQIGKPYKSAETARLMFGDFPRAGPAAFVAAVNHSIGQNYQGIYAPSGSKNGNAGTPSAGKEFSRDARGDL